MAVPDFMLFTQDDWDTATPADGDPFINGGTASVDYAQSGMRLLDGASQAGELIHDISGQSYTECWVAFNLRAFNSGDHNMFQLDAAGDALMRIQIEGTLEYFQVQRWDGAAWQDIGSQVTAYPLSAARRFDVYYKMADSGGEITVYCDRNSVATYSGDTKPGSDTTIDQVMFTGQQHSSSSYIDVGFVMVDGSDTRKLYVVEDLSTSFDSDTTGGSEANVDEYPGASDESNFNTFDAANEKSKFNWTSMDAAITDSFTVELAGVLIAAESLADPAFYMHGIAEISATEYDSDNSVQPASGVEKLQLLKFATDPSTASPWANKSAVEAVPFGVEARTSA